MTTTTCAVVECNVLRSPHEEVQEQLVFLPDGNPTALVTYLAEHAGGRAGRPFSGHLEAMRHLAREAAYTLREHWSSRPGVEPYPDDVPIAVRTLDDVPRLPDGLPVIFALTDAPRGDQLASLKLFASTRYTDSRTLLPAATPAILLQVLRREGLASWSSWKVRSDSSAP